MTKKNVQVLRSTSSPSVAAVLCLTLPLVGCTDSAGGVNIWSAVDNNDVKGIEAFVGGDGDLEVTAARGVTPLMQAFLDEKLTSYETLLVNGADPDTSATDGRSIMVLAASRQDRRWLRLALDHGGDPDLFVERATIGRRGPPLQAAIRSHSQDCVELLLDRGADVNYQRRDWPARGTALISAVYAGNFKVVLLLLEHGADWKVPLKGNTFLDALKTRDKVTYRQQSDRDELQAVKDYLQKEGAFD